MSSLDRLINLARRTGDRLIVHNELEDSDVVIMGVDEYERLVAGKKDSRSLSSRELLDQINRDIASWRANKELDEKWEQEMLLDEEMEDEGPFDPFAETDSHLPEWHSAGAILEDRYGDDFGEELEIEDIPDFNPEKLESEIAFNPVPFKENNEVEEWKEEPLTSEEPVFYEEPV